MRPLPALLPFVSLLAPLLAGTVPFAPARADDRAPHEVTVDNRTGGIIREIYITGADNGGWGANRLVHGLPSGFSATIRYTGGCQVNLRVVGDAAPDERRGVGICDGGSIGFGSGPAAPQRVSDSTTTAAAAPAAHPAAPVPAAPTPTPGVVEPQHWNGHFITKRYGGL